MRPSHRRYAWVLAALFAFEFAALAIAVNKAYQRDFADEWAESLKVKRT